MIDALLGESLWYIVCGRDLGPWEGGSGEQKVEWDARRAWAVASILMAMDERVRSRYMDDRYRLDPAALWGRIEADHTAVAPGVSATVSKGLSFRPEDTAGADPVWVVDSGCTRHATGNVRRFIDKTYSSYERGEHRVQVANNGVHEAAGYGDITMNVRIPGGAGVAGRTLVRSVLHVPECGDNNILSMSQLEGTGMRFEVEEGKYKVLREGGEMVAEMDRVDGLYILRSGGKLPSALAAKLAIDGGDLEPSEFDRMCGLE